MNICFWFIGIAVLLCVSLSSFTSFQRIRAQHSGPYNVFYIFHDDVIKWKHFPRNWPFVREIHRSPVNFPHKGQWRGALMFSLIYAWINDWVNNREAGDLRRQHGHYDVIALLWDTDWIDQGRISINSCTPGRPYSTHALRLSGHEEYHIPTNL